MGLTFTQLQRKSDCRGIDHGVDFGGKPAS
jgi:hypothetical protein